MFTFNVDSGSTSIKYTIENHGKVNIKLVLEE